MVILNVRQSRRANDSASIAKRAKERFRNREKTQQEAKCRDYQKSLRVYTNSFCLRKAGPGLDIRQPLRDYDGKTCVLWRGLKTPCHHSLMHIDHFPKKC